MESPRQISSANHLYPEIREKNKKPGDRLKVKFAAENLRSAANFNACRQVSCFSDICYKVSDVSHPSFPEGASGQRYPDVFCTHPVSTDQDNFKF